MVAIEDRVPSASEEEASRLRLILEATPNAMVMVGGDGRIVLVNGQAEELFGFGRADLLSMRVEQLIPQRSRRAHLRYRTSYQAESAARPMGAGRDLYGLRSDGTEVPIEIGLNPIVIGEEKFVLASVIDISERLAVQDALAVAGKDSLRRSILASMPCSVLVTDLEGRIVAANPATERLLGHSESALLGRPLTTVYAPSHVVGQDWTRGADGEECELGYRRRDGSEVTVGEAITPVVDEAGQASGYLAVAFDITKRLEVRARVAYLADHDALTGLPNRSMLTQHLVESIATAERNGSKVALLLLDVDHFKRVNDSLGHHAGDRLLLRVAEQLAEVSGEKDLVARLGGDEFVMVFSEVGDLQEVRDRIKDIAAVLPTSVMVNNHEVLATVSVGCAVYPDHGETPSNLLKNADVAMYRAKAAGRNNVRWFQTEMLIDSNEKLVLSASLRHALERDDELSVVYQPQVSLATGEVVAYEALARWNSRSVGQVPPDRFIPVAEDSGLIAELGGWVLRRACQDAAALRRASGLPLRIAVNVSPRQFARKSWVGEVQAALDAASLPASALELEITEGILMNDDHDALAVLHTLKEIGTRIVVDDFGQGYSSLAYLTRFPVDKLKIDREFVRRLTTTDADAAVIDAILAMAHALGMSVAAEGVETVEQARYLRGKGCDKGQGFFYGEGAPFDEVLTRTLASIGQVGDVRDLGAEGREQS
ncbi:putative bifunctional diguanylate cyclase/phosphodiesterase [Nocardioides sp. LML1-1-1.1]|uniref:putative bifunctional diguanylate cyclase/phosphodiesterase n=1 Tax=Nocardioides sp. LML1-1-1.1 TaxID=3135248 RepID=UPI003422BEAB